MTVSYAAHFLLSLRQQAEHFKRSTAIIFFDLKSAFYRAQRSTVVCDKLGYGEDQLDEDVAISTLGKEAALDTLEFLTTYRLRFRSSSQGHGIQLKFRALTISH